MQEAEKAMKSKHPSRDGRKGTRSRKGVADIGAEKRYRAEAKADRERQQQQQRDRPDRGGPQGRKDKDFQRKF
jgi:hypothetical protein